MIVGTAGHIDHGKTALVKALTGIDADRLKEEKARGITIDLGFAYLPLPDGNSIGFVDVPGHERLVHTMLAGASGIDLALLLVAADDGVMPQTREHLAILDLIGVPRALVVLSKADRADGARRSAVERDSRALLAPTRYRAAPVMPVSTVTGEGVATLKAALTQAAGDARPASARGRFRLAIDRSFTLTGVGTVVTGTVLSGTVAVGDRVVISPSGLPARVRGLHAQNRPAERGVAGQRCALNLAGDGVGKDAIARGDVTLDPALHAPTMRIDAHLRLLPRAVKAGGSVFPARLHVGATETGVRVVPLGAPIAPGRDGFAQLVLDRPIAAASGDRFVLRDAAAQNTIGGGTLLDLRAPARKRSTPERLAVLAALREPDATAALATLLARPSAIVDGTAYARDRGLDAEEAAALPDTVGAEVLPTAGGVGLLSRDSWVGLRESLLQRVAAFHAEHPELQGIGRERLRFALEPRLPPDLFAAALERLVTAGDLAADGGFVRLPVHAAQLSDADEALWQQLAGRLAGDARFRPPRVRDLAAEVDRDERDIRRVLSACARLGRVDQIATDHFFLRATTAEMVGLAVAMQDHTGWFTAAHFRDRLANGRKVAIQVLDFFDRHGITMRRGDLRRLNPHRLDLFGSR